MAARAGSGQTNQIPPAPSGRLSTPCSASIPNGKCEHGLPWLNDHAHQDHPPTVQRDKAGFTTDDQTLASVRAHVEVRHASVAWVNWAAYSKATALFRIRTIPGLHPTTDLELVGESGRWEIDSIEPSGRYTEILAHQDTPEGVN